MKNKFITLTALVITILLTVNCMNADVIQKKIHLKQDFTSITLKANANLNITIGSTNQLTVETDSSELNNLEMTVTHNTLLLNTKDKHKKWWDVVGVFDKSKKITFNLTVKHLNNITIAGIGKVKIHSDISADDFTLTSMSAANITAKNISGSNIKLNILGEGNNKFTGLFATNSLLINSRGSSHIYITHAETQQTLNLVRKQWRTENLQELVETEIKIRSSAAQLKKAERKLHLKNLYSPVDGTVNQIEVTTIGESVSPAQPIITIVPDDQNRIAEVSVQNQDIGFIHEGQTAEIKLDTFPFHKYGIIEGKVINISPDAIVDQKTGALTYNVFIKPLKNKIKVGPRLVNLTPGMTLTGEIKTGTRRIIEYFLDPMMKFKNEAFKER